ILQVPIDLTLHDILPGGRVLLAGDKMSLDVFGFAPNDSKERSLGALSGSIVADISRDGQFVALVEFEAGGTNYDAYVRRTDGAAPVRLGEGSAWAFSPDGKWLAVSTFSPPEFRLLPTGVGEPKRFKLALSQIQSARFLSNDRIALVGSPAGHAVRT